MPVILSPRMPAPSPDDAAVSAGLSVRLGPLHLAHPIINASGTMEIFDLAEVFGEEILKRPPVAAYVSKTVTVEPRDGNPPPRILETAGGMINAIGLSGEGIDAFTRNRLPRLLRLPCPLIVSAGGFSVDEYTLLASRLREALEDAQGSNWTAKAGLELNISCPNVKREGMVFGTDPAMAGQVVAAVRQATSLPLIAKLTPNVTDITQIAGRAVDAGADAISLINTLVGMAVDIRRRTPKLANVTGGLSGPAIRPVALAMVWKVARQVSVPVIGIGGITTARDALEFFIAGATAIQVGTGNFVDPRTSLDIIEGLGTFLEEEGIESLTDIIGSLTIEGQA